MSLRIPADTEGALLGSNPCAAYLSLEAGLFPAKGPKGSASRLEEARQASISSSLVRCLVDELRSWPGPGLSSHKSAEQHFHKLALAVSLGLRRGDPGAEGIARKVMSRVSAEGPFGLPMKIGQAHGGSGDEVVAWALCDAPVVLRALLRMGYGEDARMRAAVDFLAGLVRDNGYPCAVAKSLGSWRGPGRKADPCPYATLVMLELLLELPERRSGPEAGKAAECLLGLWQRSEDQHPYIFYMGNDFRKLKAPLIWYDLLHVLEALTKAAWLKRDPRLGEMLDLLESKADENLLFTPESVYQAFKAQDFGQKKATSPFLSAIALGILSRVGRL